MCRSTRKLGRRCGAARSGISKRDGGYADTPVKIEVDDRAARWLSRADSMLLGTAGFLPRCAVRLTENRRHPRWTIGSDGRHGGAVRWLRFFAAPLRGPCVSGKAEQTGYLKSIGASEVLGRDALATTRPMESTRFGGGLDNVGGPMLTSLLAQTAPYGNVATAGLAASHELDATVMPFIIRGVSLLGVASAGTARGIRDEVWSVCQRLAAGHLDRFAPVRRR